VCWCGLAPFIRLSALAAKPLGRDTLKSLKERTLFNLEF
jgi:hypothetical protein